MTTIKAFVIGGRLELDVPANWPDGTEVEIQPVVEGSAGDVESMSPAEIAETLSAMDKIEPIELTEVERVAWEAERRARKELELSRFMQHGEELRRAWE